MKTIAVLSGDGIGPEIMTQTLRVLPVLVKDIQCIEADIGGIAFEKQGSHFPNKTKEICDHADAILFGSVGGPINEMHLPKWKNCEVNSILALRKNFEFFANVRKIFLPQNLLHFSPLKLLNHHGDIDFIIFRELLGDCYFGEHSQSTRNNIRHAHDIVDYDETQIRKIAAMAFNFAKQRQKKVISVDKANVLATSKLWRTVVDETKESFPEITLEHMLVDNCAMQLIFNLTQFDVIVTSNLFGDILSDLAASLVGSIGMVASASFNDTGKALYEPIGGSAPSLAGKDIANPTAQMLSLAMLLRYSLHLEAAASTLEYAIFKAISDGHCTKDICANNQKAISTTEFTDAVIKNIQEKHSCQR